MEAEKRKEWQNGERERKFKRLIYTDAHQRVYVGRACFNERATLGFEGHMLV